MACKNRPELPADSHILARQYAKELRHTRFDCEKPNILVKQFSSARLKETTMDPDRRTLLRVTCEDLDAVNGPGGRADGPQRGNPRFRFIQDRATFVGGDELDV